MHTGKGHPPACPLPTGIRVRETQVPVLDVCWMFAKNSGREVSGDNDGHLDVEERELLGKRLRK